MVVRGGKQGIKHDKVGARRQGGGTRPTDRTGMQSQHPSHAGIIPCSIRTCNATCNSPAINS